MPATNKELVRRFFDDAFNSQNMAACEAIMADPYVEHAIAPFGQAAPGRVNGPVHLRETVAWLRAQFPDLHMTIEAMIDDTDLVACRILSEGTNLGKLNGMVPPTGRRFAARQSHWFRVEGGQLAEHWATRDDLTSFLQLGLIQPPGR
jgi:predicted ester cyclase